MDLGLRGTDDGEGILNPDSRLLNSMKEIRR